MFRNTGANAFAKNQTRLAYEDKRDLYCRQGDPWSPYLFILSIEPLAQSIKNAPNIGGLKIGSWEIKLGQYADDTFLILDNNET